MSFDHADSTGRLHKNIIHASAEKDEAYEEIKIWFDDDGLQDYEQADEELVR
jgi:hypothetical protein